MKHSIVYSDPHFFAGWPANHGAWQWDNELRVGFMIGPYKASMGMHRISEPFLRVMCLSLDGGATWSSPLSGVMPDGRLTNFPGELHGAAPPPFDLNNPDTIIRACGVYDTGGDYTSERGCFYLSEDRGVVWRGPFDFTGIHLPEDQQLTARTCTVGDLVFLSAGQKDVWGTDYTFVAWHDGERFFKVGTVCEDDARAVMPAVVSTDGMVDLFCVLRRKKSGRRSGWIDSFRSFDRGMTWQFMGFVDETGGHNGNPPALVSAYGDLYCFYGNRDAGEIRGARYSFPKKKWETFLVRASESRDSVDIGYPRAFYVEDKGIAVIYYWTSDALPQQHIAMTTI